MRDAAPLACCLKRKFNASSPTGRRRRQLSAKNPIKVKYGVKNNFVQLKTTGPRRRVDGVRGRPARLNRSPRPLLATAWLKMSASSRRGARPFRQKRATLYCGTAMAYCEGRTAWPACLSGYSPKARLTTSTSSRRGGGGASRKYGSGPSRTAARRRRTGTAAPHGPCASAAPRRRLAKARLTISTNSAPASTRQLRQAPSPQHSVHHDDCYC